MRVPGATSIGPFQGSIAIPDTNAFKLDRLFVTFSDDTGGEEGSVPPTVTVPVLFGPRIMPGFGGYWLHTVARGDTSTAISRRFVGQVLRIRREL